MDLTFFTIAEMAEAYKVTLRTLRFYEQKGLLRPSRRGGQRLFSSGDRVRLELILTGKRLGFTIAEIKRLIDEMELKKQPIQPTKLVDSLDPDLVVQQLATLSRRKAEIQSAIDQLHEALSVLAS